MWINFVLAFLCMVPALWVPREGLPLYGGGYLVGALFMYFLLGVLGHLAEEEEARHTDAAEKLTPPPEGRKVIIQDPAQVQAFWDLQGLPVEARLYRSYLWACEVTRADRTRYRPVVRIPDYRWIEITLVDDPMPEVR